MKRPLMKRPRIGLLTLLAAALGLVGGGACGDEPAPLDTGADVVTAWTKAGLEAGEVTPTKDATLGDADCHSGTVEGIEATVCEYADDAAASAARTAGLKRVGNVTGASLASGKLLLVVADRRKVDPSGRKINRMTKIFRRR